MQTLNRLKMHLLLSNNWKNEWIVAIATKQTSALLSSFLHALKFSSLIVIFVIVSQPCGTFQSQRADMATQRRARLSS